MARSSAEDVELRRACAAAIAGSGGKDEQIALSIRVAKGRGIFEKLGRLAEPRVLAITTKRTAKKTKCFIRVLKYSSGAGLESTRNYKLKHLTKLDVVSSDPSGCTFFMGFHDLRSQSVAPPQWTMRNIDDRNRLLFCILNLCKETLARLPKVNGIDIVELALWAKDNTPAVTLTTQVGTNKQEKTQNGDEMDEVTEREVQIVSVEKDLLVSQEDEKEEDMESLLGTYLMGIGEAEAFSERMKQELIALEAANVYSILETEPLIDEVLQGLDSATICVDDIDEWLQIFNVKLRHMREDIASIESRNNNLELVSDNCKILIDELDSLLIQVRIPPEFSASLTNGSFEEKRMLKNVEACEWLSGALRTMDNSNLDPCYANIRAVRERRDELVQLKIVFVKRATDFLRTYFATLADFMLTDKAYFAQFRGQLRRPDHADLRYKCRTYARLLQHLKSLDKNSLVPLRKAYCQSLNLLLRREAREFSNEIRSNTNLPRNPQIGLDGSSGHLSVDTSMVSESYSSMLRIFIPLLVEESSFFAHFMSFDGIDSKDDDADELELMDPDGNDIKSNSTELVALNESLKDLLDGIQEDFYAIVDWGYKIDPLRCISMYGVTERYLSGQKADSSGFVRKLLDDLSAKISSQFNMFIDENCAQIERTPTRPPIGILSYMTMFGNTVLRMEQNIIQGQSRDMLDKGYAKLVTVMFEFLEKVAGSDSKSADIIRIENYAAFLASIYDLANGVPSLATFYRLASGNYEQACTNLTKSIINLQFERLFGFYQKVQEEMRYIKNPEEIPFRQGLSKTELRRVIKSSLSGIEKSINGMYRKLQKSLITQDLILSLWGICQVEFLSKYQAFVDMVFKIYGTKEPMPLIPVEEMKVLFADSIK